MKNCKDCNSYKQPKCTKQDKFVPRKGKACEEFK